VFDAQVAIGVTNECTAFESPLTRPCRRCLQGMVGHAVQKWMKALKLLNQIFDVGDAEQREVTGQWGRAVVV
jgi:hypothetical protein